MLRTSSQRQAVRDGALRLRYRCIFATSFAAASLHLRCVFAASSLLIADVSLQSTRRSSMPFWSTSRRRASSARSASCCSREGVLSRRRDLPFLGNGRLRYEADYGTDGVVGASSAPRGSSRPSSVPVVPQQLHFPGRQHLMPAGPLRALRLTTAGGAYLVTPAYQGSHPILAVLDSNSTTFHAWPWWVE